MVVVSVVVLPTHEVPCIMVIPAQPTLFLWFQSIVPCLLLGQLRPIFCQVLHLCFNKGINLSLRDHSQEFFKIRYRGSKLFERDVGWSIEAFPHDVVKPHPAVCFALSHQSRWSVFSGYVVPVRVLLFFQDLQVYVQISVVFVSLSSDSLQVLGVCIRSHRGGDQNSWRGPA